NLQDMIACHEGAESVEVGVVDAINERQDGSDSRQRDFACSARQIECLNEVAPAAVAVEAHAWLTGEHWLAGGVELGPEPAIRAFFHDGDDVQSVAVPAVLGDNRSHRPAADWRAGERLGNAGVYED